MSKLSFRFMRIMVREIRRLRFVYSSMGLDDSMRFAKQGVTQYTQALKSKGNMYDDEFRASIIVYLIFLKKHEQNNNM